MNGDAKFKRVLLWTIIMSSGFVILLYQMWLTNGMALQSLTYRVTKDTFYDFTISILAGWDRENYGGMYPPLIQIFFHALACVVPNINPDGKPKELINSPLGALYTLFFLMGCALMIAWLFQDNLKVKNWLQRIVVILLFLSGPYIYCWQRGNVIILVVPLIILFAVYYDSDNAVMRVFALIALAIAAGIKMYPAILGLMLVIEKRWKQAVVCIVFGLIAFVAPAFYFDGINTIILMFERLFTTSGVFNDRGVGHQVGLVNFIEMINQGLGAQINGNLVFIIIVLLVVVGFVFTKYRWQRFTLLTALMVIVPSISFQYAMVLMTLPLLMYFREEQNFRKMDYVYIILFAMMFLVVPIGGQNAFAFTEGQYYALNYTTVLENISINLIIVMIVIESLVCYVKTDLLKQTTVGD